MRGEIRKCPCCGLPIRRGKLMCPAHWTMVPAALRKAVNNAWAAFRRAPCGQPAILALAVYDATYATALAGVMAQLEERKAA